jgi:phospholipid-transporting ATPase
MVLQMIPSISITNGQPTILLGLLPIIVISIMIDYYDNAKK